MPVRKTVCRTVHSGGRYTTSLSSENLMEDVDVVYPVVTEHINSLIIM